MKEVCADKSVVIVTCEYPPFPGGIGTYSGELAAALRAADVQVTAVVPRYRDLHGDLPAGVTHHYVLKHHKVGGWAVVKLLRILRRSPKQSLVLAADVRTTLLLWLLRPFHRKRYRVMVHGSEASKFTPGTLAFAMVHRAYHGAELVAYNSLATRDIFRKRLGIPRAEALTYLGVQRDWFEDFPGETFLHPELAALNAHVPVFCTVGRIEARKGQLEAVRALAHARDKHNVNGAVYVMAGKTEDADYERRVIAEAKSLSVSLIATGRLVAEDVRHLYRRSLAHLLYARALPGKIEGFGLVLLEAAAQECPSIATRVGGIPEVLGDTGSLVEEGDLAGFAACIAAEASDPERRKSRGEAARTRATQFTWAACAAATFPELESVRSAADLAAEGLTGAGHRTEATDGSIVGACGCLA